jgi:hypothetical protein
MKKFIRILFILLLIGIVFALIYPPIKNVDAIPSSRKQIKKTMGDFIKKLNEYDKMSDAYYNKILQAKQGIQTITQESNKLIVDGKLIETDNNILSLFAELNGKHPYSGRFVFFGINFDGTPKQKNKPNVPIMADFSPHETTDRLVSVGYADGSVRTFRLIANKKFDITNIRKILVDGISVAKSQDQTCPK